MNDAPVPDLARILTGVILGLPPSFLISFGITTMPFPAKKALPVPRTPTPHGSAIPAGGSGRPSVATAFVFLSQTPSPS